MADEEAANFLTNLELGHLVEPFKAAGAKKEDFQYLRDNLVELMVLAPILADRRKIVEAFDKEQASSSSSRKIADSSSKAPVSIRAVRKYKFVFKIIQLGISYQM
uniref:(northern house mosquito) hypothetical protein n=1 Tax=Culex pipiens TaxID=7175 RepID=A0A8D8H5V0_CULPI